MGGVSSPSTLDTSLHTRVIGSIGSNGLEQESMNNRGRSSALCFMVLELCMLVVVD